MNALHSPLTLSEEPSTTEFPFPEYDWETQTRNDTVTAGRSTSNSVQTFDSQGKPRDSQSDNND